MIVPALIYFALNPLGEVNSGWGIPMATDIAFALGVLYLLGNRIPLSLKVFLTALAIVDDLGAVLVIALFYTSDISMLNLAIGLIFLLMMYICNKMGVRSILFYANLGVEGVWTAFLLSGVHATIASVLAAFTIPADVKIQENVYMKKIQHHLNRFKYIDRNNGMPTLTNQQLHVLLAAIGFTMSLFVTSLAFSHEEYMIQAKIGIFAASIIGGILGYMVLSKQSKQ